MELCSQLGTRPGRALLTPSSRPIRGRECREWEWSLPGVLPGVPGVVQLKIEMKENRLRPNR
jgi:hypothetical protein